MWNFSQHTRRAWFRRHFQNMVIVGLTIGLTALALFVVLGGGNSYQTPRNVSQPYYSDWEMQGQINDLRRELDSIPVYPSWYGQ